MTYRIFFVCGLILAPTLSFGWSKDDLKKPGSKNLIIDIGYGRSEGIVMARKEVDGEDVYVVSLFFQKTPFRSRIVSKQTFLKLHDEIFDFYQAEKRSADALFCTQKVRIAFRSAGTGRFDDVICLDLMRSEARRRLVSWYNEAKSVR